MTVHEAINRLFRRVTELEAEVQALKARPHPSPGSEQAFTMRAPMLVGTSAPRQVNWSVLKESQLALCHAACLGPPVRALGPAIGLSPRTAKNYMLTIYDRLSVTGRRELASLVVQDSRWAEAAMQAYERRLLQK